MGDLAKFWLTLFLVEACFGFSSGFGFSLDQNITVG
jgi:hypothetical protein